MIIVLSSLNCVVLSQDHQAQERQNFCAGSQSISVKLMCFDFIIVFTAVVVVVVFIYMIHRSMLAIVFICLARQLVSWPSRAAKTYNIGLCTSFYTKFFFIPAMLIGTTDFYHFIPLSLALTMAGNHGVGGKQNLFSSFSRTSFKWSEWNLIWCRSSEVE